MARAGNVAVYLEVGPRRTFASAVEWPGWCRSGRGEDQALEALAEYVERYRSAVGPAARRPALPRGDLSFSVVERLDGDATTDFGSPGGIPSCDHEPLEGAELRRQLRLLGECWDTFDRLAGAAEGRTLATGPRGGGRDLARIRAHAVEADSAYLARLGGRFRPEGKSGREDVAGLRAAFEAAVGARARGEVPDRGPRGGLRWPARYAVRRAAWHALDHAWEIEDR